MYTLVNPVAALAFNWRPAGECLRIYSSGWTAGHHRRACSAPPDV